MQILCYRWGNPSNRYNVTPNYLGYFLNQSTIYLICKVYIIILVSIIILMPQLYERKNKKIICKQCNYICDNLDEMLLHYLNNDDNHYYKTYACKFESYNCNCRERFINYSTLKRHKRLW
jgi:hypothetical protein